jgi:hypothetical protein
MRRRMVARLGSPLCLHNINDGFMCPSVMLWPEFRIHCFKGCWTSSAYRPLCQRFVSDLGRRTVERIEISDTDFKRLELNPWGP